MASMNVSSEDQVWAESLTAITYMRFDDLNNWENTINTVANKAERGQAYETFKAKKAEDFLIGLGVNIWKNLRVLNYDGKTKK